MPARGLQILLATALTDTALRTALLAGDSAVFGGVDLTEGEVAQLRAIRAETLEDFARGAHRLFYGEDPLDEVLISRSGKTLPVVVLPARNVPRGAAALCRRPIAKGGTT